MPTRVGFHGEMRLLEDDLLRLADRVGNALERAVEAWAERDAARGQEVRANDEHINNLYAKIERETLELIARQQPMAGDLREIMAVYAIAADLERIGDYAKGIATIALRVLNEPPVPANEIAQMVTLVRELLDAELDAFMRRDPDAARRAAARDDEVDALYSQVYRRLIQLMTEDPTCVERASRVMWAAKSLERAADHVTNIGERVVFLATGEVVELNG
jgi:phosphate transport system protein